MEKELVYLRIDSELDYQEIRWDVKPIGHVPDNEKSVAEWLIYMEYHLNLAKERIYGLSEHDALAEIRKITALGVRTMMIYGCPERKKHGFISCDNGDK